MFTLTPICLSSRIFISYSIGDGGGVSSGRVLNSNYRLFIGDLSLNDY